MSVHVVLVEPEIPQNTGNIARTCAATASPLHLIHPLGFSLSDKAMKRAGLDYWSELQVIEWPSLEEFLEKNKGASLVLATTKASKKHSDFTYTDDCFILFGKETKGLPVELLADRPDSCVRIPMYSDKRSLNLSNAVAIVLYEALRQLSFPEMK